MYTPVSMNWDVSYLAMQSHIFPIRSCHCQAVCADGKSFVEICIRLAAVEGETESPVPFVRPCGRAPAISFQVTAEADFVVGRLDHAVHVAACPAPRPVPGEVTARTRPFWEWRRRCTRVLAVRAGACRGSRGRGWRR